MKNSSLLLAPRYRTVGASLLGVVSFLLLAVTDFFERGQFNPYIGRIEAATYFATACSYASLFLLICILLYKWKFVCREVPPPALVAIGMWGAWCLMSIVRGVGNASDYWEWKQVFTGNALSYSVYFAFVLGISLPAIRAILGVCVRFLFLVAPLVILLVTRKEDYLYSYMVMPIALLLLLVPYVNTYAKVVLIATALLPMLAEPYYRTNAMRMIFALLLIASFYFRRVIPTALLKMVAALLIAIPLSLVYLGFSGTYNIFEHIGDVQASRINPSTGEIENFAADTRTLLYSEVLDTMARHKTFALGEGAAAAYDTVLFETAELGGRRFATEVGFLNVLLNLGVLGVVLFLLVTLVAVYYSLWRSNNWLSKTLGLAIAFRWVTFFIEDIPSYQMTSFFFWIAVGLALNGTLRLMTDAEIKSLFKSQARM